MSLPGWLEPLPDAEQMRQTDAWVVEVQGVPSIDLMESAGAGLVRLVDGVAPDGRVVIACGGGNNGGDGLVAARLLRERGRDVDVLATAPPDGFKGDARTNLDRLPGDPPRDFDAGGLQGAAVIVDALLGTGFSGEPREPVVGAIDAINGSGAAVVACDVPSGVDASTGAVTGNAVQATATATFHAAKPGLWIAPGKAHAGEVHVLDIGIPAGAPVEPRAGLIRPSVKELIPRRASGGTKFTSGHLVVAGGSTGMTGAPSLASEAAMRAGAGYVTAGVPASLNMIFEIRLLEVMTLPLPDDEGGLVAAATEELLSVAGRAGALVLGPGLGRAEESQRFARELPQRLAEHAPELAVLIDADGLNAHAGQLDALRRRSAQTVLTPHTGELGRLLGIDSREVEARRLECAREAAEASGSVVVLKGDDTLVVDTDGRVAVSRGDSPALATAGTGDVLSGVIGALLAKHMLPWEAACAGVHVHAAAGRLAAAGHGTDGVIASDVIEALPRALAE